MTAPLRVCVCTGTRAEFGLLETVMRGVDAHAALDLRTIVAGAHLLPPAFTHREVEAAFRVDATVAMQRAGETGRGHDAHALGRGVLGFAAAFDELQPDWVVVLGDRVEAFAAACAASVGGRPLAHVHAGDRAEGVADEAMRSATSKLANLLFAATDESAQRLVRMGEDSRRVRTVGSPAVDDLGRIDALRDDDFNTLGAPTALFLMHPVGRDDDQEERDARATLDALQTLSDAAAGGVLALHPNHDPGRNGLLRAIEAAHVRVEAHLPRARFVGLLKRLADNGGFLAGNSSAALIEAAALRLPAVDIGDRQRGRERPPNVVHIDAPAPDLLRGAIGRARGLDRAALTHPYGDGDAGRRIAAVLADVGRVTPKDLRKRNTY